MNGVPSFPMLGEFEKVARRVSATPDVEASRSGKEICGRPTVLSFGTEAMQEHVLQIRENVLGILHLKEHEKVVDYIVDQLIEQLRSIVPITFFVVAFIGIFFQRWIRDFWQIVGGQLLLLLGLLMFLEGLKVSFVPLSEVAGAFLPKKFHTAIVLTIGFVLGIIVNFAEPAIAALQPLGALVRAQKSPIVYLLLNDLQIVFIVCIGAGVGLAAVIGTLRYSFGWRLKMVLTWSLLPTIAMTFVMHFWKPELRLSVALAWDCGGVTTGPVTIPILLALGIGVADQANERRVQRGEEPIALSSGFGIVALASLLPVLTVQLLCVFLSLGVDKNSARGKRQSQTFLDRSPYEEIFFGVRAILALGLLLLLLVKVVLRKRLPRVTLEKLLGEVATTPESSETEMKQYPSETPTSPADVQSEATGRALPTPAIAQQNIAEADRGPSFDDVRDIECQKKQRTSKKMGLILFWLGLAFAQIGIITYNLGLTYGMQPLAEQVGKVLPGAFDHVAGVRPSPRFPYALGVLIVVAFSFALGFLVTLAEPALKVMGSKVEELSAGKFSKNLLMYSGAGGVGVGATVGVLRIIYHIDLIWIVIGAYAIAYALTLIADNDEIIGIAWDSAGVTTGEVTSPFVLAMGLNFAKAANSSDGFGILTLASCGPIISVLLVDRVTRWRSSRNQKPKEAEGQ